MTPFRERREFKVGRAVEQAVSGWLMERGWLVIPSYDYAGDERDKAPKLRGIRCAVPVPDLDVCKNGRRRWVEVKAKTSARWYYKGHRFQHGIEHYDDYLRVQAETGSSAWLAVVELTDIETADEVGESGLLLMQSFAKLGKPQTAHDRGRPMAYWPRDSFERVYQFTNVTELVGAGVAA